MGAEPWRDRAGEARALELAAAALAYSAVYPDYSVREALRAARAALAPFFPLPRAARRAAYRAALRRVDYAQR